MFLCKGKRFLRPTHDHCLVKLHKEPRTDPSKEAHQGHGIEGIIQLHHAPVRPVREDFKGTRFWKGWNPVNWTWHDDWNSKKVACWERFLAATNQSTRSVLRNRHVWWPATCLVCYFLLLCLPIFPIFRRLANGSKRLKRATKQDWVLVVQSSCCSCTLW